MSEVKLKAFSDGWSSVSEFMVQKALSSGNGVWGSVNMYGFSHSEKILLAGGRGEEGGWHSSSVAISLPVRSKK